MNLKHKIHKQYMLLVAATLLLMCLLFYKLKLLYSFDLWTNYQGSMEKVDQSSNASFKLKDLRAQGESLFQDRDTLKSKQELQAELFALLNSLASSHNVNVMSISNPAVYQTEHYEVTAFEAEILGGFHGIVESINQFESNKLDMKLVSMSYKKSLNRSLKRDQLKARLYIQHYKTANH